MGRLPFPPAGLLPEQEKKSCVYHVRKDGSLFFLEPHPEKPGKRKGAQESEPAFQVGEQ